MSSQPTATSTTDRPSARRQPPELGADLRELMGRVEQRLQQELRSPSHELDQVIRRGYRLGGKRVRPLLVLLAGQAVGPEAMAESADDHVLLATVVEMIHTATLVHDDVLDEASLRRHEETVNARWGNETSVLLGDFLFSHAFYLASTIGGAGGRGSADACRVIGRSTNRVCEGEMRQTLAEGDFGLSQADYFTIIDAKTAELCACCCDLGARYAGGSPEEISRLAEFGRQLGIAFQIADDLLDLLSDEGETGKTVGADLAKQKLTLPVIHARDTLVNGPRRELMQLLERGREADIAEVRRIIRQTGSLEFTRDRAALHARRAAELLAPLPDSPAKQALAGLAEFTVARRS